MKEPWLKRGQSDPVSYTCTCTAKTHGGAVLLFYRYWNNTPVLPQQYQARIAHVEELAAWHKEQTQSLGISGKIRIAKEGYNVTVAGTKTQCDKYMQKCCEHWSFQGLLLDTQEHRHMFFKPTEGCACVFGAGLASVRVTAEATPMGVEGYSPASWNKIESLSPEQFHVKCHKEKSLLLDVRNHYESKIGYFVCPQTGDPAIRPPVRRFSQWPQYVKQHRQELKRGEHKQIMTYCTGGIRCEKGVRWMQENMDLQEDEKVYTLHGGIAAYLMWIDEEIKKGCKTAEDSLFKGKNYVFDARGSIGLSSPTEPISSCHVCSRPSDNLSKCHSSGCHLVLVLCPDCDSGDPRCCQSCRNLNEVAENITMDKKAPRPICECEQARETELWGGERIKEPKTQGWKTGRKRGNRSDIKIEIQTIE